MGGTRKRHFDGTNFKPRKVPKNAQTPTTTPACFAAQSTCGASVAPTFFVEDRVHDGLGKCVPKGVLSLHYRQQYVIGLLDRHYPSPIEVHTDRECDGMSLGRNS